MGSVVKPPSYGAHAVTRTRTRNGYWEIGNWQTGVEELEARGLPTVNLILGPGMVCSAPLSDSWRLGFAKTLFAFSFRNEHFR